MRKSILTSLTLLLTMSVMAQFNVTFRVDMSEYTGPAYSMVNVNGDFNNWCGECAVMEDPDGDMVYELVIDLPAGQIEYKFTTDGWTTDETFIPGGSCTLTTDNFVNRVHQVTADEVLPLVCWESCDDCSAPPSAANVTFQVDMNQYTGSYSIVNLNGTFNGWCGGCAPMADDDGDGIYSIVVNVPTDTIEYKFTVDGWTDQENLTPGSPCTFSVDTYTNRILVPSVDVTLPAVCWSQCETCIVGLDELNFSSIINMTNDGHTLSLRLLDAQYRGASLIVSDSQGKSVMTERLIDETTVMDIATLSEGVYLITLATESGLVTERMVLVR